MNKNCRNKKIKNVLIKDNNNLCIANIFLNFILFYLFISFLAESFWKIFLEEIKKVKKIFAKKWIDCGVLHFFFDSLIFSLVFVLEGELNSDRLKLKLHNYK